MPNSDEVERLLKKLFDKESTSSVETTSLLVKIVYRTSDQSRANVQMGRSEEERYYNIAKNFRLIENHM